MTSIDNETRPFGDQDIPLTEKEGEVKRVFDHVARRYDHMTDSMSLGVHRLWKRKLIDRVQPNPSEQILDVAGGTGDLALECWRQMQSRTKKTGFPPLGNVVILDINLEMLLAGLSRKTEMQKAMHSGLSMVTGNAEKLPFPDNQFDAYMIGFGIRNVSTIEKALAEALRVLKPGGRFYCLEFSRVTAGPMRSAYRIWSEKIMPKLGKLQGIESETNYLVESIKRFPTQEQFALKMEKTGFRSVRWSNLSNGIAAIHQGWKF